jgi:ADP-ribosylglycohydrolase
MKNIALDILIGLSVGDALGVPYEFLRREVMDKQPASAMTGYGTHNQPPGTWSDDSSLAFCLAEMLAQEYDLNNLRNRFINWQDLAYWTAHDEVFDIGIATSSAITNLRKAHLPQLAGGSDEHSNGNGSLMRILPLILFTKDKTIIDRFHITSNVSSLTHAHSRSVLACFIYLEFALQIIGGKSKFEALKYIRETVADFCTENKLVPENEVNKFHRILGIKVCNYEVNLIENEPRSQVYSTGYVLSTLEASIWCIMNSETYSEAVLKAVNLGGDTDTTGCVTGGLAGLIWGHESIPKEWLMNLARIEDIKDLANRLSQKYQSDIP